MKKIFIFLVLVTFMMAGCSAASAAVTQLELWKEPSSEQWYAYIALLDKNIGSDTIYRLFLNGNLIAEGTIGSINEENGFQFIQGPYYYAEKRFTLPIVKPGDIITSQVGKSVAQVTIPGVVTPIVKKVKVSYGTACDQRFVTVKVTENGQYSLDAAGTAATYYFKDIVTGKVISKKVPLKQYYKNNQWFNAKIIPTIPKGKYVTWVKVTIDKKNYTVRYNKVIEIRNSRWYDTKVLSKKYF